MALRIVHTSDWHLGQTLKGHSRDYEHKLFLDWLLDVLEEEQADALLVAGDIFDKAISTASAQQLYYDFLLQLRARLPSLETIVIGGNHDSSAKLDAPSNLIREALGTNIVGGYRAESTGRMRIPLHDRDGELAAWVAAVPFLRRSDYSAGTSTAEGYGAVYDEALGSLRSEREEHHALIAMGHCHMAGGTLHEGHYERDVLRGGEEAVPASLFSSDVAYVALGHLHLAQQVGDRRIRYCGSPIPLSMTETNYEHQVLVVDFEGADLVDVRPRLVPRAVPFHRFAGSLERVVEQIGAAGLPDAAAPADGHPFIDVDVHIDSPQPLLSESVRDALRPFGVREVRLKVSTAECQNTAAPRVSSENGLSTMTPEQLFLQLYATRHSGQPDGALLKSFQELVKEAEASTP